MARSLTIGVVLGASLACGSGASLLDIAAPFEPYLQGIFDAHGLSGSTVIWCESFGSSRKGRCWTTGKPAEVTRLLDLLDGAPASPATQAFGQTCLDDPAWGQGGVPHWGVLVREFGPGFPTNQQNIRPERAYVNPDGQRVCIELSFPYG